MTALLPEQIALMAAAHAPRRSLVIRIVCATAIIRFWTGFGPLTLAVDDDLDPAGRYRGAGVLKSMPSIRQVTDGKAVRVNFEFFARHPAVEAMMAAGIADAQINVGYVFFDDNWQLAGPAAWLWQAVLDVPRRKRSGIEDRRILSAISGAATRKKAGRRYWSKAGHQSRHPGDRICDDMSKMTVNTNRKWPPS